MNDKDIFEILVPVLLLVGASIYRRVRDWLARQRATATAREPFTKTVHLPMTLQASPGNHLKSTCNKAKNHVTEPPIPEAKLQAEQQVYRDSGPLPLPDEANRQRINDWRRAIIASEIINRKFNHF